MKHKKIIPLLLLFTILPQSFAHASSMNDLKQEIKDKHQEMEGKEEEQAIVKSNIQNINGELQGIVSQISSISSEISTKENEIRILSSEIELKESLVKEAEKDVRDAEKRIEEKLGEIEEEELYLKEQQDALSLRVRESYKTSGVTGFLSLLLESRSLLDFFERLKFIEILTIKDRELIEEINLIIDELTNKKNELEILKTKLIEDKRNLENEKGRLLESKQRASEEQDTLSSKRRNLQDLEKNKENSLKTLTAEELKLAQEIGDIREENEALEAQLQEMIREAQRKAEEERRKEEERKKAEAEKNNSNYTPPQQESSKGYVYPASGRLTSPFGFRIHPIFGDRRMHTGIDIAAPTGTTIKATRNGTVIAASYMSGYGNTIIVDHGGGISSLYPHLSSYDVRVGDRVSAGERIAGMGSTGNSTGPHLHFEIRVNGVPVNPMNYIN